MGHCCHNRGLCGSVQADINPAISFAKYLLGGTYTFGQLMTTIAAELSGAFFVAVIVWLAYLPHWKETDSVHSMKAVGIRHH